MALGGGGGGSEKRQRLKIWPHIYIHTLNKISNWSFFKLIISDQALIILK